MPGIIMGLLAMALVPIIFVLCPGGEFSCQVVQSVSVVFGLMALALTVALVIDEWQRRQKSKKPEGVE